MLFNKGEGLTRALKKIRQFFLSEYKLKQCSFYIFLIAVTCRDIAKSSNVCGRKNSVHHQCGSNLFPLERGIKTAQMTFSFNDVFKKSAEKTKKILQSKHKF